MRFNDVSGSSVGKLNITSTNTKYAFGETSKDLDDVRFTAEGTAGDFVVGFTAYDTDGESYAGVLTITVQQYTGDMDVLYIASRNEPLTLSSKDFEAFWEGVCPNGELEYICFDQLPRSVDGTLYTEYESSFRADPLRLNDELYVEPVRRQYAIDNAVFVPSVGVKQTSYITLKFTGYGTRSTGRDADRKGVIYIFFTDTAGSADVSVTASTGGTALDPAAFRKAYQNVMGGTGTDSFYIQLLDVPVNGGLYLDRTASKTGTLLTPSNAEGRLFACGTGRGETIGALTYVPGTAVIERPEQRRRRRKGYGGQLGRVHAGQIFKVTSLEGHAGGGAAVFHSLRCHGGNDGGGKADVSRKERLTLGTAGHIADRFGPVSYTHLTLPTKA